jgi:hypothetical protein
MKSTPYFEIVVGVGRDPRDCTGYDLAMNGRLHTRDMLRFFAIFLAVRK